MLMVIMPLKTAFGQIGLFKHITLEGIKLILVVVQVFTSLITEKMVSLFTRHIVNMKEKQNILGQVRNT
ncbi:MAG: hypothetical protein CMF22_10150 [Idiomarinaceae bacterium]|nr:hypothetical protein [Idiomarinaceae bacterium]MBG23803.1 hypothetical protein [Idiomarinaceae bacterium]